MRRSAIVLCQDAPSLRILRAALAGLEINPVTCISCDEALKLVVAGVCSTLVVDFDLPGAGEVAKLASLLTAPQKPVVFAMTRRVWPGTGQAFQSGANRILYKPLDLAQLKDAFDIGGKAKKRHPRKFERCEMKSLVYLEFETGTVPAIGVDLSEHGFGVRATEPVQQRSNLAFHCVLPGTTHLLRGHADVMWSDGQGRAGLFFSRLAPAARKHLKNWLRRQGVRSRVSVRALLPPVNASVYVTTGK
jgi:CheY-like chemotaxis protein